MLRILLIEDDPDVAAVTGVMLEYLGHHVTIAANGVDGLDIARKEQPGLVISDFMLPMMSGLQLIETLRESGFAGPVILCSAVAESHLPQHAAQYDAFLRKPYALSELMKTIELALQEH